MAINIRAGFIKITCVEFFGQCKRSYKNKKHMSRISMLAREVRQACSFIVRECR